jgi:two-component system response regulator CpxR
MAKLLIIEDDPLISRMYKRLFTLEGYEVEIANNGQEGLQKVKTTNPSIILLDVMMPTLNGLQTLEILKSDPETKMIPVIMLSNLTGEQDAEEAINKGAVKYIVKSAYEPEDIAKMIKEVLTKNTS